MYIGQKIDCNKCTTSTCPWAEVNRCCLACSKLQKEFMRTAKLHVFFLRSAVAVLHHHEFVGVLFCKTSETTLSTRSIAKNSMKGETVCVISSPHHQEGTKNIQVDIFQTTGILTMQHHPRCQELSTINTHSAQG